MKIEDLKTKVKANIEPALQEIKKLTPKIKHYMGEGIKLAQNCINQLNFNSITVKVQQVVQQMRKQIESLNKKNQIAITINNLQSQRQISQFEKEIDSLQKKTQARKIALNIVNINNIKNAFSKIIGITKNVTKNIRAIGTGIKSALSNVLKFVR